MRNREPVDLEEFLNAALRIETLLVGLACLVTVSLVLFWVSLDISNGKRQCGWIAGVEQDAVDSRGYELGERTMVRRDRRDARSHSLDGNEAEGFLPDGGQ